MTDSPTTTVTRFAPSPSGELHLGNARTALFNYLYARRNGGSFVLRIEDTDRARFREDSEQQVYDTLRWLGLGWDEGPDVGGPCEPYRQSERLGTYRPYVDRLLEQGLAYHCWCSTERLSQMREAQQKAKQPTGYDRLCVGMTEEERSTLPGFSPTPVVRMLIPDDVSLVFDDLIRGEVCAPRPDDQVILKADGFPTYHLAVVVDPHRAVALHVRVPAHRHYARARAPNVAAQKGKVHDVLNRRHRVRVVGQPHAPGQHGGLGTGIVARNLAHLRDAQA